MTGLAVLARVALASVFGLAGAAKLVDGTAAAGAATELGAPARASRTIVVALAAVELALAALLVVPATTRPAAAGAAFLALALAAVVGVALALGRRPECRCFGSLSAGPIGPQTLARNLALAVVAAALAAWAESDAARADPVSWLASLDSVDRLALAVAALTTAVAALALALLRAQGRLLLRVDALEGRGRPRLAGPPVGAPAPALDVVELDGGKLGLDDVIAGTPQTLLVFSDSRCGPCQALLPDVARWQRELELGVALVSAGPPDDVRALAREHGLGVVLLDLDGNAARAYGISGTPSAVLVDRAGRVVAPAGAPAIAALAEPPAIVRVG
jgi:peroxiredoxin